MSIDISLIPQERIKDLVSTLDTIQSNISTIDGNLTTTTSNLSTLQTNVSNNYTTLDNKIDSESSRIINIMDSNCVHKTGNEEINGIKTFNNECKFLQINDSDSSNPLEIFQMSRENAIEKGIDNTYSNVTFYNTSGEIVGIIGGCQYGNINGNNQNGFRILIYDGDNWKTALHAAASKVTKDCWITTTSPNTSSNDSQIATTNWSKVVHPTYPNITTSTRVSVPANTDYSIPYDCWVWWGNTSYVGVRYLYVNGIEFGHSYGNSGHWEEFNTLFFPIKVGNVIRHTGDNSTCFLYQNVY